MRIDGLNNLKEMAGEFFWKIVPVSIIAVATSYVIGKQMIHPHHRAIKAIGLVVVLIILLKFELIYSLYFFIILFMFPSGLVITSTNVILLTMMSLVWIVRAKATGQKLVERTNVDVLILLFLAAYLLSLINVESTAHLNQSIKLIWRQLTAFGLFYMIVTAVDNETKFERITKVLAFAGGLAAFTGIVELVAPGTVIIPGWITTNQRMGEGMLGYRIEGIRLGGAFGAHNLLSDFCSFSLFLIFVHLMRAKNPVEKTFWLAQIVMAFTVLMATANRGAMISTGFGFAYALWVFRRHMSLMRYVVVISGVVTVFGVTQLVLQEYTVAASVTDRILGTQFEGMVPDSRVGIWESTFVQCFDHIFIGHGPYYETSKGLVRVFWPHNGYLYYLYTLGLFGLGAFVMIAFRAFRTTSRYTHPLAADSFLNVGMSVMNVLLAMFLLGQMRTDHQRHTDFIYIYIVWMFFGLAVASGKILDRKIKEHREAREGSGPGESPA